MDNIFSILVFIILMITYTSANDSMLFLVGGYDNSLSAQDTFTMVPIDEECSNVTIPSFPEPKIAPMAAVIEGHKDKLIIVCGGIDENENVTGNCWIYNGTNWNTVTSMKTEVAFAAAGIVGSSFYVVGGNLGSINDSTDVVQIYDIENDVWSYSKEKLNVTMEGGCSVTINNHLVIIAAPLNETIMLEPSGKFIKLAPTLINRNHCGCAVVKISDTLGILIAGGIGQQSQKSAEFLPWNEDDPTKSKWIPVLGQLQSDHPQNPGIGQVGDKILIAGGNQNDSTVEILNQQKYHPDIMVEATWTPFKCSIAKPIFSSFQLLIPKEIIEC